MWADWLAHIITPAASLNKNNDSGVDLRHIYCSFIIFAVFGERCLKCASLDWFKESAVKQVFKLKRFGEFF